MLVLKNEYFYLKNMKKLNVDCYIVYSIYNDRNYFLSELYDGNINFGNLEKLKLNIS